MDFGDIIRRLLIIFIDWIFGLCVLALLLGVPILISIPLCGIIIIILGAITMEFW